MTAEHYYALIACVLGCIVGLKLRKHEYVMDRFRVGYLNAGAITRARITATIQLFIFIIARVLIIAGSIGATTFIVRASWNLIITPFN